MLARSEVRVDVLDRLDRATVEAVTALVDAVTEQDGVRPLSEHVTLHLRYGGDAPGCNVLAYDGSATLVAYAHLDVTNAVAGPSAELAVHPAYRGRGIGRRVVQELLDAGPDGRLRLWAHGGLPAAAALAASMGFEQVRELWQMRRSLFASVPAATLPADVRVRTFRPGEDDEEWVKLNARAFASHPEQGAWTIEDLHRRMAEPWFDAHGFFVAEREGRLVGFHWTKIHGGDGHSHGHEPIGEVYVVGVDPSAQAGGLGRALTLIGLAHLRSRGLPQVMLYVDADNAGAIAVYQSLGFTRWDTDVMFRR
ncbi:MAG: mycothiol synthase [Actinomycetota bacterium]|nr:mycothiol synthase [Actinomycetota bacterium]